ncbi:MAG: DUF3343 domain-containing protein [Clostridia bacterium]|jgi:hypothetical protein|nr:DUF3343 domain-containing protein [Clostridia bacterium]
MKYIFSFRSRNCAFRFYDALKREGISSRVVNAPRAGGSCALGVELQENDLPLARRIANPYDFPSFIGVFESRA